MNKSGREQAKKKIAVRISRMQDDDLLKTILLARQITRKTPHKNDRIPLRTF